MFLISLGSARCTFIVSTVFAFWNITLRSSYDYSKGVVHLDYQVIFPSAALFFKCILVHFRIFGTVDCCCLLVKKNHRLVYKEVYYRGLTVTLVTLVRPGNCLDNEIN